MGYLHSTPKSWPCSRGELAAQREQPLGLPDLEAGQYLVIALLDAGPTTFDAMGERPLSWPDLAAYATATGQWEPWELKALRDMSRAYLAGKQAGVDPLAVAPVDQEQ